MTPPTVGQGASIFDRLQPIKEILRDVVSDARMATTLDKAEFHALEQEVFEILRLIRSWRNVVAPINKIPPEILTLIPDFFNPICTDQDAIILTHVCRAWREVFVYRSSLWADLDCKDEEKTRVFLERSKSSPINLTLYRDEEISPCDPFFQITPHAIGRLKSLSVEGPPENIQVISAHLSHPAPHLEHLKIYGGHDDVPHFNPAPTSGLFDGDLSSLRTLYLEFVRTGLPWRNMASLTSFTLVHIPPGDVSVGQLLDFFEGAPCLREVTLCYAIPTTGTQNGQLVSLARLKTMYIEDYGPSSILLDHLLIPVGARLTTRANLLRSVIGEHLPRSLDNLKNLTNFTTIQISAGGTYPRVNFGGPNGEVTIILNTSLTNWTSLVLETIAQLDASKTEQLEIIHGNPPSRGSLYQALLPMTDLRTLILCKCMNPRAFIHALHPDMNSSEVVVCPRLEELILVLRVGGEKLDIRSVIEMSAARASRGERLKTVRIVDREGKADLDVSELRKHVWNVEYNPSVL